MGTWQLAPVSGGTADWTNAREVTGPFWPIGALSARQRSILLFLLQFRDRYGAYPTAREIADGCGLASPSSVINQLRHLQDAGWLQRGARLHAAVHVVAPTDLAVHCDPLPVTA